MNNRHNAQNPPIGSGKTGVLGGRAGISLSDTWSLAKAVRQVEFKELHLTRA